MAEILTQTMTKSVLAYLGLTAVPETPDVPFLDQLMHVFSRTVPWESASRIVRRTAVAEPELCPRWPEKFWQDSIDLGTGGTCFESNYAYFALLKALGFEGYLTINNMGDTIGCHSAIVVLVEGQKWLVDAGFPIYVTLPMSANGMMHRRSSFLYYAIRPDGRRRYHIEQHPHPNRVAFTLIDEPVSEPDYRAHTMADYGAGGLFLDAVIMNKIVNDQPWRFNMRERPWALNRFEAGQRYDVEMISDPATAVARHFGIDEQMMQQAFSATVPYLAQYSI